jgi:2-dehydropantoate 2-reductase
MRFLVLGAGALGGYFGARLLKGGADVTFLVRPGRAAQLLRDGLVVKTQHGELRSPAKIVQKGAIEGPYDVVLLCCKAYDLDGAVDDVAPAMGERSVILPLLNGVMHIDVLKDRFGARRTLGGVTAVNAALMPDGAILQSPVKVHFNFVGPLGGESSDQCIAIQKALDLGGMPITVSNNIEAVMWAKLFGFACSAAISSLTRSRAGPIARSGAGPTFVSAVIDECSRVATAEGFPPPPQIVDAVRGLFSQADSTYGPSLLIDMEDGRPTEGQHTIGDLADRAARRGVAAPILAAAMCNLQAYELGRQRLRAVS